ncbi:MAG: hypothetical protein ABW116_01580 [Candidatus Sedimenticola sp. 20ELBAFRAG]
MNTYEYETAAKNILAGSPVDAADFITQMTAYDATQANLRIKESLQNLRLTSILTNANNILVNDAIGLL